MVIRKLISVFVKGVGMFVKSGTGKKVIASSTLIGVGLAGNGVRLASNAKKKNNQACIIQNEALSMHDAKLKETNENIANFGFEAKKSKELFDTFLKLTEKIKKCPSMNEIDSTITLPTININEIKKMSNNLDLALSGAIAGVSGALPGLVFCGASISVLGFAALGSGIVLSIKGSKLSRKAVKNLQQANKLNEEIRSIIDFYKKVDNACIKITKTIRKTNNLYQKELGRLEQLVKNNNNYKRFSINERTLLKNNFKLTILLANMCETKLAKRVKEVEIVNTNEIEQIIENANILTKEIRQSIYGRVAARAN